MTSFREFINEEKSKKYKPKDRNELWELCDDLNVHLGDIDTSLITDMSNLFGSYFCKRRKNEQFEGIEDWDVSKVTDMENMFNRQKDFNRNLNKWDVSNVRTMRCMFDSAEKFNQPLNKWNLSKLVDSRSMFCGAKSFNQDISMWKTPIIKECGDEYRNCPIKDEFKAPFINRNHKNY